MPKQPLIELKYTLNRPITTTVQCISTHYRRHKGAQRLSPAVSRFTIRSRDLCNCHKNCEHATRRVPTLGVCYDLHHVLYVCYICYQINHIRRNNDKFVKRKFAKTSNDNRMNMLKVLAARRTLGQRTSQTPAEHDGSLPSDGLLVLRQTVSVSNKW